MVKTQIDSVSKALEIAVDGDILSTNIEDIRKDVLDFVDSEEAHSFDWKVLGLDLTNTSMIDSTGLNFLVALCKHVKSKNATMKITISSENIYRSFSFIRLDRYATIRMGG